MIGQEQLLDIIKGLIENNKLPKFMLLIGQKGSGKKCLAKEIAKLLDVDIVMFNNKVDDTRECIQLAYEQKSPILYVLTDGDTMSIAAKNSILKLIEEPPTNATIIMLAENEQSILPTILSRAYLIKMENYNITQLKAYIELKQTAFTDDEIEEIVEICDNPGMINDLMLPENKEVMELAKKLVNNVDKVTLSNVLKVTKKLKLTESSEGIDVRLFVNCLEHYCYNVFIKTRDVKYSRFYNEIINTRKLIRINTTNKLYTVDNMLIQGWKIWNYGN